MPALQEKSGLPGTRYEVVNGQSVETALGNFAAELGVR
jgi:hypothetical protein